MPAGKLKLAPWPGPSSPPRRPVPANVDTAPLRTSTRRTRWFLKSVTSKRPRAVSSAQPIGAANRAASPTPSAKPSRLEMARRRVA